MLGSLRLLLALLVALSHAGVRLFDFNPGVSAVVVFYLISGYVMTGLLRTHYPEWRDIPAFYLDRALRLYPQYLFIAGLTLIWMTASGARTAFLQRPPSLLDMVNNLAVVPLNLFMFNDSDQFTLIPPAWSLGAEIQFYLLVPILLLARMRGLVLLASFAIFLLAAWQIIHTEWFGYRLLPGVMFMFLLGSYLYEYHRNRLPDCALPAASGLVLVGLMLALGWSGRLAAPYNVETLTGLLIGLPALHILARMPRRGWDDFFGDLSYGVFLCHFLVLWLLGADAVQGWGLAAYLSAVAAMAFISQRLVERPILRLRRKLRTH